MARLHVSSAWLEPRVFGSVSDLDCFVACFTRGWPESIAKGSLPHVESCDPSYRSVRHCQLALVSFPHSAYVALCGKLTSILVASILHQQEGSQLSTLQTADW